MNFSQNKKYNYPYEEAQFFFAQCHKKEEFFVWHKRFTPWFQDEILYKLSEIEENEKKEGKRNLDNGDLLTKAYLKIKSEADEIEEEENKKDKQEEEKEIIQQTEEEVKKMEL